MHVKNQRVCLKLHFYAIQVSVYKAEILFEFAEINLIINTIISHEKHGFKFYILQAGDCQFCNGWIVFVCPGKLPGTIKH